MTEANDISPWIRKAGLFAGPAVFLIIYLTSPPEGLDPGAWHVAGVALLMAIWWITESIPIPVTALLPVVFFPILGVRTIGESTSSFANPLIFLFLGGFLIALALQRVGLHRRIALNIILLVGTKPSSIIIGFMIAAAFLSMWVSNTATTIMMLPIALSIITLVEAKDKKTGELPTNFGMVMLLGLAYACNIGGIGTLIGTPPNALMAGYMLDTHGIEIGFVQWMLIGLPIVIVAIPAVYLVLTKLVFPLKITEITGGEALIREEVKGLGNMSRAEVMVGSVFIMTAVLWVTRPLLEPYIPNLSDAGIAIFGAALMFLLPVDYSRYEFVMKWEDTKQLPWGVLILFGGGLSLAAAISGTGLADWIGFSLSGLDWISMLFMLLISLTLIIFLTEITSNTATAAAFIPILASVAIMMGYDPLLLVIPAAIGASCAFMMPIATPPNAIVYGSGLITIPQMAKAGFVFNLLMVFLITGMIYLLLGFVFGVEY
ncbi:MAG: DASS family sodium-coupled anion symporter [Balneolales bacterium]